MFEDKTMVADTLAGINGELMRFGEMIPQTENKELKTTLKQFRAACEQSQKSCIRSHGKNPIMSLQLRQRRRRSSMCGTCFPKAACRQKQRRDNPPLLFVLV